MCYDNAIWHQMASDHWCQWHCKYVHMYDHTSQGSLGLHQTVHSLVLLGQVSNLVVPISSPDVTSHISHILGR